ncbi:uncharacterized protein PHALS_03127 [Plasmopara halstedii]|uniref:Uncharacterized protein n=1 Tax=Plasmopara halstedii TaxID=4781 RepID=A0A0P1A8M7_PLAHL|nr:uncharacterized protein PHALS_03127 [Plasmopara halstedii]CEG36582.1 hypothetical protein PHALS_03127 [Plasmopara halstedii]|eukprot:XP_024572951.1 hypothetical protein PHALS_03127 [Plasmopara halstedii]
MSEYVQELKTLIGSPTGKEAVACAAYDSKELLNAIIIAGASLYPRNSVEAQEVEALCKHVRRWISSKVEKRRDLICD